MELPKPNDFTAPFIKKEQLTKDAYSFYFNRQNTGLEFIAGQYNRIILPHENPDNRGSSRLFSIASSPLLKDYFFITTRIGTSTFKKALLNLIAGTPVSFWGPTGRFVLNEESQESCIFLAGGIGITPFHNILTYASARKLNMKLSLFVSFSTADEIIFYDELMGVEKLNPNIKVIYTVSKPEESKIGWDGEVGRIDQELINKYAPDFKNSKFYIAGPTAMVTAMLELVVSMGISPERILKENFVGY